MLFLASNAEEKSKLTDPNKNYVNIFYPKEPEKNPIIYKEKDTLATEKYNQLLMS